MSTTALRADEILHDRRRHLRVPARGVASFVQTMDASMPGLAVENLSQSGLFVRCSAGLSVGTRVMVQLVRPGLKRAIAAQGYVVSLIAPMEAQKTGAVAGMGIRLDTVDHDAAQRLRDLVDDLAVGAPARAPSPPPAPAPVVAPAPAAAPVTAAAPAAAAPAAAAPVLDTAAEEAEARSLVVQQLEEEVVALRREILRQKRTIGHLATRLATYEEAPRVRPVVEVRASRVHGLRAVDPRAD